VRFPKYQSLKLLSLRIALPLYPQINYGDRVVVEGEYEDGRLKNAKLLSLKQATSFLFVTRIKILTLFQSALPEPHTSLVAGIVLGSKASIPENFWASLIQTGTVHVVVASGMNVTLVAKFLLSMFLTFLSRKKAVITALIGIWTYTAISGFDAPLIRAAIMGSIAFSAQVFGKLYSAFYALVWSALLMLLFSPSWLSDLGFIMSFVATFSLMLFQKRVERFFSFLPKFFKEGLSTSLAAQIGVAPIILVTFGRFSLLSPIVNALVLWTIPYITILGMTAGIIGLIFPFLGRLIVYLIYPFTTFFVSVVNIFS
jgi:competence protein ComEC